jgi:hypothetical protein
MPIHMEQTKKYYTLGGSALRRPAVFKEGDLDATITITLPVTPEDLEHLVRYVDMFALSMGTPGVCHFDDGIVRAQWHKDVPPPDDGQNWVRHQPCFPW